MSCKNEIVMENKELNNKKSSAEFLMFKKQIYGSGIEVKFENEDQKSMRELVDATRNTIRMYIQEIYNTYELEENSTSKEFLLF